ncbi:hypothetical protein SETIT_8G253400v2 [Setaria italica]|uniref:Uncharacterized protein n=1 Tax=Setaria italica TaxID=4555 RepID=A0A368SBJ8_SETIT|nr:hypothetical protein SETIT_8G253200v2 [Setaria italica]RCV39815.1 hypothetical protein SETIT_8G253400v2 [Setaria italica]
MAPSDLSFFSRKSSRAAQLAPALAPARGRLLARRLGRTPLLPCLAAPRRPPAPAPGRPCSPWPGPPAQLRRMPLLALAACAASPCVRPSLCATPDQGREEEGPQEEMEPEPARRKTPPLKPNREQLVDHVLNRKLPPRSPTTCSTKCSNRSVKPLGSGYLL